MGWRRVGMVVGGWWVVGGRDSSMLAKVVVWINADNLGSIGIFALSIEIVLPEVCAPPPAQWMPWSQPGQPFSSALFRVPKRQIPPRIALPAS
eukprot:41236-Prymnesium_polylepis.2